jgi:hypothetical protein
VSDFGPMATQVSKPHSRAVGSDFLDSYEGAPAMHGNRVPRYGKGATPSGAALYPKMLRISHELRGRGSHEKNQGRDMVEGEKRKGRVAPREGIANGLSP